MNNDVWLQTQPGLADDIAAGGPTRSPLLDAKVMLVDDEPLMTALVQTHLEEAGYTNLVAINDPRQTLEVLRREDPGVLLLDLMMPQMSGFEVLEAIRATRDLRYTPVIVLTAASTSEAKLRALQLGATDFLSKPVDASELVLRVRNTLAFRQYTQRLINFDSATGLPNVGPFEQGIDLVLSRSPLAGGIVALFSIDLPDQRLLRESLGPQAGDRLVQVLVRRLQHFAGQANPPGELATPTDKAPRVARLEAERFGMLLEGLDGVDVVESTVQRLLRALCEPVMIGLHEVVPTPWIGIALAPADGADAAALRKSADLAATHARQRGMVSLQFASAELNQRSLERLTLGSQLRNAVERGQLKLHYQPKVDLRSGRIVGAEALIRWQHPEQGLLPPARFIPLAEEIGLITGIGRWVAEQACRDAAAWAQLGFKGVKVAINVAQPQFASGDFCKELRHAVFDAGLDPALLVVELTESMLMHDVVHAIAQMHALKKLGVTLSIDDFGTGYSSLSYLKRFPLDELKIDRSFVADLPGRASDLAIARSIVDLGHSLGMSVIAEGVETEAQRETLAGLGCDLFQGYLFARPVPVGELVALLRRSAAASSESGGP